MSTMFCLMNVSKSGYYEWLDGEMSNREKINMELTQKIQKIHQESRGTYGGLRIFAELREQGMPYSLNRVLRLKRKAGILAKAKKRFKATTDSKHNFPIKENVLNREFNVLTPNTHWASDISYGAPVHP